MKTPITPQGWIVTFGGAAVEFDTRPQAKRFVKLNQNIADQHGGKFKATIARNPVDHSRKAATL